MLRFLVKFNGATGVVYAATKAEALAQARDACIVCAMHHPALADIEAFTKLATIDEGVSP